MANSTFYLELNTYRKDKIGCVPVRLNYQVDSVRKRIQTAIKVFPENWDKDNQQVIYLDKRTAARILPNVDFYKLPMAQDVDNMNDKLDAVVNEIKDIEKRFVLDKITYSAEMVIDAYNEAHRPTTKKEDPKVYLSDYLEQYINDNKNAKRTKTICNYTNIRFHLSEFDTQLTFADLSIAKLKSFQSFLLDKQKLSSATVVKLFSILKTALKSARIDYRITVNPEYLDFVPSVKRDREIEVIALTQDELQAIIDIDLSNPKEFV